MSLYLFTNIALDSASFSLCLSYSHYLGPSVNYLSYSRFLSCMISIPQFWALNQIWNRQKLDHYKNFFDQKRSYFKWSSPNTSWLGYFDASKFLNFWASSSFVDVYKMTLLSNDTPQIFACIPFLMVFTLLQACSVDPIPRYSTWFSRQQNQDP